MHFKLEEHGYFKSLLIITEDGRYQFYLKTADLERLRLELENLRGDNSNGKKEI